MVRTGQGKQWYFIQEHKPEVIYHGSIGNMDAEQVFLANGLKPIRFPYHNSFSWWAKLVRVVYLLRLVLQLPVGAVVVFQHPLYAGMNKMLVKLLGFRKSITVVCFIADINGLKYDDAAVLRQEVKQFRSYRYFIVHNEAMLQWLHTEAPQAEAVLISFFDFLTPPAQVKRAKGMTVCFAGNLEKSSFLEKLYEITDKTALQFNLYGPQVTPAMQAIANVTYKGVALPYELPRMLEGSFGLIWDGEGVEGPAGSMGHYMAFITHHKTSLYILANTPIIVYEGAGSAALVKKYQIGITVNSLFEIEEKIKGLTEEEYQQMCENMRALARQISTGGCLTGALNSLKLSLAC